MPIRVREALAAIDYSSFDKISQALSQLDLTFQEKTNGRKQSNSNVNNLLNYNHGNVSKNKFRNQRSQGPAQRGEGSRNFLLF